MSRKAMLAVTSLLVAMGGLGGAGPAHAAPAAAEAWAFLPWDSVAGRVQGDEADSTGPRSFAVLPEGGVLVLDQVNLRIMVLDPEGAHVDDLPLPASTFDDVEQLEGRAVLALDRLGARALLVMDLQGAPLAEVALEGRGIARSGLVTALLPRPDGVWLEVGHRYSVKVLDQRLQPCDRRIVLGRPIAGGRSLHGAKDGAGGVRIWTARQNDRSTPAPVTLTGADPIRRLLWLDADPEGYVTAALHEIAYSPVTPFPKRSERTTLVVLEPGLREVARLESPWVLTRYHQPVEVRVGPAGRIWQMAFDADGVHLWRWDWRAP